MNRNIRSFSGREAYKITIEFTAKDDFKAECYEALRSLDLAKESILLELTRPAHVRPSDIISWVKELDKDNGIRNVCVFQIGELKL